MARIALPEEKRNMERSLSRREELELWRRKTGRTYMKRFSYVQKCVPPPVTPSVRSKVTEKPLPHTCKSIRGERSKDSHNSKMTRREMLLQWQSEKKSVKGHHHTNILTPLNGTRGVKRKEGAKGLFNTTGKIRDRTIMRELFQQDIDRTVAEILKEEEEEAVPCEMETTGDSDYRDCGLMASPADISIRKKPHRRRSTSCYVDSELAFLSSTVRYSMVDSEYRKGRRRSKRSTYYRKPMGMTLEHSRKFQCNIIVPSSFMHTSCVNTPGDSTTKRLLYLTPVRRSTRKSLCHEFKGELCFDSPSQAEGYDLVEIVPNDALTAV